MHRTTPNLSWTFNSQKYPVSTTYLPMRSIFFRFALRLSVSEIQAHQKSEMHGMTPNLTGTLNSPKYPVYTKYLPLSSKFWSVLLYDYEFPRYKLVKNRKGTEWPKKWTWALNSQSTLHTYPWVPNFDPFRSTTSGFQYIAHFKFSIYYHVKRPKKNNNKRPRGLDALLCKLLVKRIPVMFKLSSTKILNI